MTQGRIETTPEQQLAELRVAYARYATLAERWREESDIDPDERQAREQDARRIAHAYEKTIASTALRMESMHRTHAEALGFTRLAKGLSLMLGVAVVAGGAAVAYLRPELFAGLMPRAPERQIAVNAPAVPRAPVTQDAVPAPSPVIAPASKVPAPAAKAVTPSQPVAKPAPRPMALAKQVEPAPAAKPTAAKPSAATPSPATLRPAPQKSAAPSEPVKTARVAAAPAPERAAAPVAVPPQTKIEPLSPPKEVQPLPVPPKSDAASGNDSAAPKPAELAAVAPPPQTSAPAAAPAAVAPAKLVPLASTHLVPPYPIDAKRAGEQGTTQMEITISTSGVITNCSVTASSGSQRLDATACSFVQRNWRWQPPTRDGREVSATTKVSVIWNLISSR